MGALRKLRNNVLTSRAVSVLGPVKYAEYVASFLAHLPEIVRAGHLGPLDKAMGSKVDRFRYRDTDFTFDCRFCDEQIHDGTCAFGIVREIYIRDCYFKHHPPSVYATARTVMDLGANRGAFSVLMASRAEFVLSVEAQEQFVPVIRHNMEKNRGANYAIEVGFVGAGGSLAGLNSRSLGLEELRSRHNLRQIDFVKMDIEGSEFAVFDSPDWLEHVNALSMEVHTAHGDPRKILESLRRHGFVFSMADGDLVRVTEPERAKFLYARRTSR